MVPGVLSVTKRMGDASGSIFETTGWSMPLGKSGRTLLMWSRTSCAATSGFLSRLKVMMTSDTPWLEVERSSSMPLMVLTAPSILSVSSVSISSGAAPFSVVVTTMAGKSIFGNWSTPSEK